MLATNIDSVTYTERGGDVHGCDEGRLPHRLQVFNGTRTARTDLAVNTF